MGRRRAALAIAAAFWALPGVGVRADSARYHGLGFTVQLPAGIAVKKSELVDFDTYEFSRAADGKLLLGAYAGNAPWFAQSVPGSANQGVKRINGLRATSYRWTDAAGGFNAELLIELAPKGVLRFPMYVHYWYRDLAGLDAALADGIIDGTIGSP